MLLGKLTTKSPFINQLRNEDPTKKSEEAAWEEEEPEGLCKVLLEGGQDHRVNGCCFTTWRSYFWSDEWKSYWRRRRKKEG